MFHVKHWRRGSGMSVNLISNSSHKGTESTEDTELLSENLTYYFRILCETT
jgi:hypothetical protein